MEVSVYAIPGVVNCNAQCIISQIEQYVGFKITEKKRGKREVSEVRQIAMYILKCQTRLSLYAIGNLFSGRDHATVLHAIKTVKNLHEVNRSYRERYRELFTQFNIKL